MIDQDKTGLFIDMECPECGRTCGNGGYGDDLYCPSCGWKGKMTIYPDDIKAIQEIMRRHKEQNREDAQ